MRTRQGRYRVEYARGFASDGGTLLSGPDFWIDFKAPGRYFLADLPPRLEDLLRIGMAIYAVDRIVRRNWGPTRSWGRSLLVKVELSDPGFWSSAGVVDALQEAVEFVTGDCWDFEFIGGRSGREWSRSLFSKVFSGESPLVCLYSGGLDSAAGLGLRVRDCPDRPVLPVTIKHQPAQNDLIRMQFERLRTHSGARIEPLIVHAEMGPSDGIKREPSCRGRSMLFAAVGAVACTLSGGSCVEVFESGIGAINIPLMAGMTGSKATRGCHPEFLRLMSRLASLVAGREIAFRLPFLDRTKGEMVRALNDNGLANLARATVSCALYPRGDRDPYKQCGHCPACLFRRQAMLVGGIEEPQGTYSSDIFSTPEQAGLVPPAKLTYLKAFLMQVVEWADIETKGHLPQAVERHLRHTRILKPGESPEALIALLARNRDEWLAIAVDGRRKGLPWARLLARNLAGQGASHATA
jgi:Queuosine biosynthesis protein QueC